MANFEFNMQRDLIGIREQKQIISGITIDLDQRYTCVLCKNRFGIEEIGLKNCLIHPLKLNTLGDGLRYTRGKYECCGWSLDPVSKDYKDVHKRGCIKIDHVVSYEQANEFISKPITLIPITLYDRLKQIKDSKPQLIDTETEIYRVTSNDEFIKGIINRYDKTGYNLDMQIEYKNMLTKYGLLDEHGKDKQQVRPEYRQLSYLRELQGGSMLHRDKYNSFTVKKISGELMPFCIIKRISDVILE